MDSSKDDREGDDNRQQRQREEERKAVPKGKSCKGYLYYSSVLKSNNRNPRCIGIPRTLRQAPNFVVGRAETEIEKEGRTLINFYYACVGYSVYTNLADDSENKQVSRADFPACIGLEILVDKTVNNADTASAPSHAPAPSGRNREYGREFPQPQVRNKPSHSTEDDFLSRFKRNANVVASGVARNLRRLGNYVKETVDDIRKRERR